MAHVTPRSLGSFVTVAVKSWELPAGMLALAGLTVTPMTIGAGPTGSFPQARTKAMGRTEQMGLFMGVDLLPID
jgi:hypothetical protein